MTGFAWISLLRGIDTSSQRENIGEILKSRRPSPFYTKGDWASESLGDLPVARDSIYFCPVLKAMAPTPVLLPGKSHGWRSLVGCSPWGRKESDTTERLPFHFSLSCIGEGNGNPLQCFFLENPRDGGAWWASVYGVAQSRTWLKQLRSSSSMCYCLWPMSLFHKICDYKDNFSERLCCIYHEGSVRILQTDSFSHLIDQLHF